MINPTTTRLQRLTAAIPLLIAQCSEEELTHKPDPHRWSKKEIIGHLIDSAINNHVRFVRMRFETSPLLIESYAQDDWVQVHAYAHWSTEWLLRSWQSQQEQIIRLMEHTSEQEWQRTCDTGDHHFRTLRWLYEDYVAHLEHHLRQIIAYDL